MIPQRYVKARLIEAIEDVPIPYLFDWDGSATNLGTGDTNIPHIFVLDKEGFLRFKLIAGYSEDGLNTLIKQVEKLV